jgi:hypothetical protein
MPKNAGFFAIKKQNQIRFQKIFIEKIIVTDPVF